MSASSQAYSNASISRYTDSTHVPAIILHKLHKYASISRDVCGLIISVYTQIYMGSDPPRVSAQVFSTYLVDGENLSVGLLDTAELPQEVPAGVASRETSVVVDSC